MKGRGLELGWGVLALQTRKADTLDTTLTG